MKPGGTRPRHGCEVDINKNINSVFFRKVRTVLQWLRLESNEGGGGGL